MFTHNAGRGLVVVHAITRVLCSMVVLVHAITRVLCSMVVLVVVMTVHSYLPSHSFFNHILAFALY